MKKVEVVTSGLRERLHRLGKRGDFRQNPAKAVGKRVYSKVRSRVSNQPWTLTLDGFRISAPVNSSPGTAIFYLGYSEPETMAVFKSLLRPGMNVVDVGAHIGEYSIIASRAVGPSGSVYAFEAGEKIFPFLVQNVDQNGLSNVHAYHRAVSDIDGTLQFNLGSDPGHSRLVVDGHGAEGLASIGVVSVPSIRLDTFASENDIEVHVLKIDVEGAEMSVFRGAESLLEREGASAPMILFEYLPRTWGEYAHTFEEGKHYLGRFGYGIHGHVDGRGLFPIESEHETTGAGDELDLMLVALKREHFDVLSQDVV
jgi:FkbM family methyltransferase